MRTRGASRGFALVVIAVVAGCSGAVGPSPTAAGSPITASRTATPSAVGLATPASSAVLPPESPTPASQSTASTVPAVLGDILFTTKPGAVGGSDLIYAMTADGSRPLRRIAAHGWMPDLSPDGKTIAFTSDRAGANMDIYTMLPDGSGVARLTGNDFNSFRPVWSPDGTKLMFSGFPGELYVVNRDGTGQIRLSSDASMGTWSPDGRRIAYVGGPDGNDEIYVMNADGSSPTRLTNVAGSDSLPSWSPDGKRIVFASERSGNGDIYVMDADGSHVTRLTDDTAVEEWPVWSPDGKQIVYGRRATRDAPGDIWVMDAHGTGQRNLTNSPADEDSGPSWR